MSQVILQLNKLGVRDILHFPFVDPPPTEILIRSLEELQCLGALTPDVNITELGRIMSLLPIEPPLAATLVTAHQDQCTRQIAAIIAMLSVPKLFIRADKTNEVARQERAISLFKHRDGDHMTLLKIFNFYVKAIGGDDNKDIPSSLPRRNYRESREFCRIHYLHEKSLREAINIRNQLLFTLRELQLPITGIDMLDFDDSGYSYSIRRALCRGLFMRTAHLSPEYTYQTLQDGNSFTLHLSCGLKGADQWILYHEALLTERSSLRTCSKIEEEWLREDFPRAKLFFHTHSANLLTEREMSRYKM
jgi:pre-mRNA-splicing factor ATP-dependent RNA helicase DHX15/PRP43